MRKHPRHYCITAWHYCKILWTVFWCCGEGHVCPSSHLVSLLAHTYKSELNWILPVDLQTRKRPGSTGECPVAQLGLQGACLPAVWPTHPSEPLCSHQCSPRTWPNVSQRAGSPRRPMAVGGFAAAPDCFTFVRCRNWCTRRKETLGTCPLQCELQQLSFVRLTFNVPLSSLSCT